MFHVTNFTESSESYWSIDKLQATSMTVFEKLAEAWQIDPKTIGPTELSEFAVDIAKGVYESHFHKPLRRIETLEAREQAVFMLNAVCSNWYGLWALNAFPRVQMSHSFAAMLMATTISPKELPHVEAPWPAFLIEVPEGLLPIRTAGGVLSHITRIHVVSHLLPTSLKAERWWALWESGNAVEVVRAGRIEEAVVPSSKKELENRPLERLDEEFGGERRLEARDLPVSEDVDEFWDGYDRGQEDRVSVLVGRLVVGVCTMMTERANYTERVQKFDPVKTRHAKRAECVPEGRIYTIGQPVKLDLRLAIKDYVEGKRSDRGPMSIQSLVAGHHKWQPHGPNNSLRKWIFIHPYWKGPADAAIAVRPHVGKTEEG